LKRRYCRENPILRKEMNWINHFLEKNRIDTTGWPDFAKAYWSLKDHRPSRREEWLHQRFVILDTETSGLPGKDNRILSFAGLGVIEQQIVLGDYLELLIRQESYTTNDSVFIHGITATELKEGISHVDASRKIIEYLRDAIIVAHHARHDIQALLKLIRKTVPGFTFHNRIMDTAQMAIHLETPIFTRRDYIQPRKYTLDSLAGRYYIDLHDRHTAWGDAFITARLFLQFLKQYEQKNKIHISDLKYRVW